MSNKSVTESEIKVAVQEYLKYAPDRRGGSGRATAAWPPSTHPGRWVHSSIPPPGIGQQQQFNSCHRISVYVVIWVRFTGLRQSACQQVDQWQWVATGMKAGGSELSALTQCQEREQLSAAT